MTRCVQILFLAKGKAAHPFPRLFLTRKTAYVSFPHLFLRRNTAQGQLPRIEPQVAAVTYIVVFLHMYIHPYIHISAQKDNETYNIDCTPTYTMFVVGFMSVSSISSVLLYILLSLQHARCRIVVTQIPVGPLESVHG